MIKLCLFDLGGVVTETRFEEVIAKYANIYNWEIEELKDKIFSKDYQKLLAGELTLEEFLVKLNQGFNSVTIENLREFATEYYYSEVAREEVIELVKELREKYKVGLITNDIGDLDNKLKKLKLDGLFDRVINSYDIGVCKPNLEIYKYALKTFNIDAKEALYIDNHQQELLLAQSLGIKTIKFIDAYQLKEDLQRKGLITKKKIS